MSNSESVIRTQKRNKLRAIEYLGGKCSLCGYSKCSAALDFHHLEPLLKEHDPSHVVRCWSWEKAKSELDKCILVCSNCHREIHYGLYDQAELKRNFLPILIKPCLLCGDEFDTKNEQQKYCSSKCNRLAQRRVDRPTKEELQKLVWEMPATHLAAKYNVSNKSIEKWCKNYGIDKPSNGYWSKLKSERKVK